MTKEDIIGKQLIIEITDKDGIKRNTILKDAAEYCMDQYARSQALAFAEWMGENKVRYLKSVKKWTNEDDDLMTTDQVYCAFLIHQGEENKKP